MRQLVEIPPHIPPEIRGRYIELQHTYVSVRNGELERFHESDSSVVRKKAVTMTEISKYFKDRVVSILNEINEKNPSKKPELLLQDIKDHFVVWSLFINTFKNELLGKIDLGIANSSNGKITKNLLENYIKYIKQLDAIMHQTQLYIKALTKESPIKSSTTSEFNKTLALNFKEGNLLFLFKSLMRNSHQLKIAPLLEIESDESYMTKIRDLYRYLDTETNSFYEGPSKENPLQRSDSDLEFNASEPHSGTSSAGISPRSTDSDSDIESRGNSPSTISPNRERIKHNIVPQLNRGLSLDNHPVVNEQNSPSNSSPNRARTKNAAVPPLVRGLSATENSPSQTRNPKK